MSNEHKGSYRGVVGGAFGSAMLMLLFLLIGFMLGMALPSGISDSISMMFGGRYKKLIPLEDNKVVKVLEGTSDAKVNPVNDQLMERVKDSSSHLNSLISLIAVIVALIAAIFGASIWETKRYAVNVIDSHFGPKFQSFRDEELGPLLENVRKELREGEKLVEDLYAENIQNLLETFRMFWQVCYQAMRELDDKRFEELSEAERQEKLKKNAREREAKYRTLYYRLCLMSYAEEVVVNAAQQIGAMGDVGSLPSLERALNRWARGSKARNDIQRAIDKVRMRND